MVILAVVMAWSPLTVVIVFASGVESSLGAAMAEIVEPQHAEIMTGLVPKASHELFFSFLQRTLASLHCFIYYAFIVDEFRTSAERHNYIRNNDLHFNLPRITCRQPSSEHASEG